MEGKRIDLIYIVSRNKGK